MLREKLGRALWSRVPRWMLVSAMVAVPFESLVQASEEVSGPPLSLGTQEKDRSPASASAQAGREVAAEKDGAGGGADDEYNFSWLDPDKKVYVLQNRKYRKKGRFAAFLAGGLEVSNPYRNAWAVVPRAAYWFSEQFGAEVFYANLSNSDSQTLRELRGASSAALPFVRENRSMYGGLISFTPWYAKLNFFNKILYFDWFFNAGAGQTNTAVDQNTFANRGPNYQLEDLFTVFFGTGQQFYVSQHFLVRLDLMGMYYTANAADGKSKSNYTNFDFTAGIGWAF